METQLPAKLSVDRSVIGVEPNKGHKQAEASQGVKVKI
jgi:hypothetical protein